MAGAAEAAATERTDFPDWLIRPGEAAEALAVSPHSLGRVDPRVLPPVRIPGLPGTVRYRRSDVERLLSGRASGTEAA